jgi:hypothetical protein
MPRRKKRPLDLTTPEAMKKLFPKSVREDAKKTALESQKKSTKKDPNR